MIKSDEFNIHLSIVAQFVIENVSWHGEYKEHLDNHHVFKTDELIAVIPWMEKSHLVNRGISILKLSKVF